MTVTESVWEVRQRTRTTSPHLLVLGHAGGSAHAYLNWDPLLPRHVGLLIGQYPGRGARYNESLPHDMDDLAQPLVEAVHDVPDLYLLGHSMGALVAFEVALRLTRLGRPPAGLLVSASRAPHLPNPRPVHPDRLDDETLADELRVRGGTAPEILDDEHLRAMVLRTVRADFAIDDDYRYTGPIPALECPVTVFGGLEDPVAAPDDLRAWHSLTTRPGPTTLFPGGHFYFSDRLRNVLEAVSARLPVVPDREPAPVGSQISGWRMS